MFFKRLDKRFSTWASVIFFENVGELSVLQGVWNVLDDVF
jgi:hypothetical protein